MYKYCVRVMCSLAVSPQIRIIARIYMGNCQNFPNSIVLTLEGIKGGQSDPPPSIFLSLNFCSLTDYQKLWHNCSLLVKTSFDLN